MQRGLADTREDAWMLTNIPLQTFFSRVRVGCHEALPHDRSENDCGKVNPNAYLILRKIKGSVSS